jgi:membrane fusion protein (multidrug efflux system)
VRAKKLVALLGIGALLALGCARRETTSAPPLLPVSEPVMDVETALVRRGAILLRISVPGSLVARRESQIGARVGGRIERVFVDEGDRVDAGAPLFLIDPATYQAALREAEAGLDLARAERRQVQADVKRARALHERDYLSRQDVDRLVTQLAVARARERQADERRAIAAQNLEDTLVRAPFAGSIAARLADEGTSASAQPPTVVLVLQETGLLEARSAIAEANHSLVQVGDRARLHVEGFTEPIRTFVTAVGDTIDPATRTYLVRMVVPNPERRYKAGVFVHAEIEPRAKSDVILVPRDAIRTEDGQTRVFAVRSGRAVAVPVRLGIVSEESAEVLEGLVAGEEIVVGESARQVSPGMKLSVTPAEGSAA